MARTKQLKIDFARQLKIELKASYWLLAREQDAFCREQMKGVIRKYRVLYEQTRRKDGSKEYK